jgi:DNA repair exonuclease SbcCD ATPase subunit
VGIIFLKDRLQKANEKIQRKTATIEKHCKTISKKETELTKMGFDPRNFNKYEHRNNNEAYWLGCDIESKWDDIKRLQREITETKKSIEKYELQLAGEMERENTFLKDVPESMKQLQQELVDQWNEYDFDRKNSLKAKCQELDWKEFIQRFKHSGYNFMQLPDETIKKNNERDAKALVIDLYYRINHITGEVTDWSKMYCSGGALNGTVSGKEGKAKVETILAGGYNIQRLHIRVLVHSI